MSCLAGLAGRHLTSLGDGMIRWCQSGLQRPGHHSPGSTAHRLSFSLASRWVTLQAPMTHHRMNGLDKSEACTKFQSYQKILMFLLFCQLWWFSLLDLLHRLNFGMLKFHHNSQVSSWIQYLHSEATSASSLKLSCCNSDANVQLECAHYLGTQATYSPMMPHAPWENNEDGNQQIYRWNMKEQPSHDAMLVQAIWQSPRGLFTSWRLENSTPLHVFGMITMFNHALEVPILATNTAGTCKNYCPIRVSHLGGSRCWLWRTSRRRAASQLPWSWAWWPWRRRGTPTCWSPQSSSWRTP